MPLLVFTTLNDRDLARALARSAVERRLAACVHIEVITSVYEWQGVQEEPEYRLLFKTSAATYDALAAHILADHPYDEPALWAVEVDRGAAPFLKWIDDTATG